MILQESVFFSQMEQSSTQQCQGNKSPLSVSYMTQNKKLETSYLQSILHSVMEHPAPLVFCNEKIPLPFYHLGLSSKQTDSDSTLPNALWELGACCGLPRPETHDNHILLSVFSLIWLDKLVFFPQTGKAAHSNVQGISTHIEISEMTQNERLETSFWKGYSTQ